MYRLAIVAAAAAIIAVPALADPAPPAGSLPPSQIIAKVEARTDFGHLESVDWDDGFYEVEYKTKDGARREIWLDPRTGETRK